MLTPILKTDTSLAPVFLRASLGVVIFAHGAQKVLGLFGGPGFSKTIEIFRTQMGFPTWMTVLLMVIEFFGSLGLIFGFLTRLCALGIGTSIAVLPGPSTEKPHGYKYSLVY